MNALPLSYWLWHAAVSVAIAALISWFAPMLHRALSLSQATRGYWLGAWMLAVVPTPLALLLQALMPTAFMSALPTLMPFAELPQSLVASTQEMTHASSALPVAGVLMLVYAGGVAIAVARWLAGFGRLRAVLRTALPIDAEDLPGNATRRELRRLEAMRIRVLMTPALVSPFALRWPRRMMVIPHTLLNRLDDRQLQLVMRHEAAHIRRHDPQWAALLAVCGMILWFNPALRSLAKRVRLAAEITCDADALGTHPNMRRAYAEAYLETLRLSMTRALPCPAIAFSNQAFSPHTFTPHAFTPQDQGSHRMRIEHIVHGDPQARKRPVLSLLLGGIALTLGAVLVTAQAASESTPRPIEFKGPIIEGRISSHFGHLRPKVGKRAHNGVDLTAARGTAVNAPAAGTVLAATTLFDDKPNYGTVIVLDHGEGWQTLYAHLDSFDVEVGDRIVSGQVIGRVGSTGQATGPHVHVEVLRHGARVDPATVIASLVATK